MSICSHDFLPSALRRNFSRNGKRWLVLLFLATITGPTQQLISPVSAQQASGWDGTWSGAWGGRAETSVQIAHGRVVRYEYQGATVPIATQKVNGRTITFGVPGTTRSLSTSLPRDEPPPTTRVRRRALPRLI